jgi:hypothetical protein
MTQQDPSQHDPRQPPPIPPPMMPGPTGYQHAGYYQSMPPPLPPAGSGVGPFFLGLAAGSVASGAVYVPLMLAKHMPDLLGPILVGAVIALKIAAIIWAFVVRRRALGAGLLASIPVAVLIFVVGCFTAVVQNMH